MTAEVAGQAVVAGVAEAASQIAQVERLPWPIKMRVVPLECSDQWFCAGVRADIP